MIRGYRENPRSARILLSERVVNRLSSEEWAIGSNVLPTIITGARNIIEIERKGGKLELGLSRPTFNIYNLLIYILINIYQRLVSPYINLSYLKVALFEYYIS